MDFKYIVFADSKYGQKIPVIFPDNMVHSEVAEALQKMFLANCERDIVPVSAGFVQFGVLKCYGKSETLKLEASEDDASLIGAYPYCHGLT